MRNLLKAHAHMGSTLVGLIAGVGVFVFFLALGAGMRDVIEGEVFPIERLEVVSVSGGLASLGLQTRESGAGGLIEERSVALVSKIRGVKAVYPRMRFAFPARAWGGEDLFGQTMWTEIVADGVPSRLIRDGLEDGTLFRDWSPSDSRTPCKEDRDCPDREYCGSEGKDRVCLHAVPFLISNYLIELYNGTIASAHGLPSVPAWVVRKGRGLELHMDIGRSSLGHSPHGEPREVRIVFAGLSDQAMDVGMTFPIGYVQRWNEEFAGPDAAGGYSSLTVVVRHRDQVTHVVDRLKRMGLSIRSKGEEQVGLMIILFQATFAVISFLILAISGLNISSAFFLLAHDRRREIGIMRAVGATRVDILLAFLVEGGILGLLGSLAGLGIALASSVLANSLAATHLPDFPFKPDDFFRFPPALVVLGLAVGLLSCLMGTVPPAWRASREDPSRALM